MKPAGWYGLRKSFKSQTWVYITADREGMMGMFYTPKRGEKRTCITKRVEYMKLGYSKVEWRDRRAS